MENKAAMHILIPFEPEDFWRHVRQIIREELTAEHLGQALAIPLMETPGLTEKPLYKMQEICKLFNITKPTIYNWIKHEKLRPVKIRSRVFF